MLWDFPEDGPQSVAEVARGSTATASRRAPSIPNLFQDQIYKYGSFGNPDPAVREQALRHPRASIAIARGLKSRDISLWFADGSNYPGTANIRQRKQWFEESLRAAHAHLSPDQRMLVEYKPFEPAFYHTDIADWGMALLWPAPPGRRRRCWSTPVIITSRRTSNRSWRGCSPKTCSAVFTSTIAAMPTTT